MDGHFANVVLLRHRSGICPSTSANDKEERGANGELVTRTTENNDVRPLQMTFALFAVSHVSHMNKMQSEMKEGGGAFSFSDCLA